MFEVEWYWLFTIKKKIKNIVLHVLFILDKEIWSYNVTLTSFSSTFMYN